MLTEMAIGLREAGVRFVIAGGYSARVQTSGWLTDDLDICYALDPENLRVLATVMREWGATYRERAPGSPASDEIDEEALRHSTILNLQTRKGFLDLLSRVAGVGSFEACRAVSVDFEIAGASLALLDVPALVEAKRAADRPKDRDHLHILETSAALTWPEYADGVPAVLYRRLRAQLGERLSREDALTLAVGAFMRVENLERLRLLARRDADHLAAIDRELASLPDKRKLAEEARNLAATAEANAHRLSGNETAALHRAVALVRRHRPSSGAGPH